MSERILMSYVETRNGYAYIVYRHKETRQYYCLMEDEFNTVQRYFCGNKLYDLEPSHDISDIPFNQWDIPTSDTYTDRLIREFLINKREIHDLILGSNKRIRTNEL